MVKDLKSDSLISVRMYRWLNITILGLLQIAVASAQGIQALELYPNINDTSLEFRQNDRGTSFRTIARELKQQFRAGDIVIVQAPSPLMVYTGIRGDYFLQSIVYSSIFFNQQNSPYYMDKWVGNPVLRNMQELQDILYHHDRVWFVSVPHHYRNLKRLDIELQELITRKMHLVAEANKGRLYLWENKHLGAIRSED